MGDELLRKALAIYADPNNWETVRTNMGHGDSADVLKWIGPKSDVGYGGPTLGPEYAARALAGADPSIARRGFSDPNFVQGGVSEHDRLNNPGVR